MTYLVLARKWRPRSFDTLIGQEHVVRALTHALETQRLHHAWLFTGTRGVGKTTLSRILAKSLNCEQGITAHPCGVCQACTEIDAGRYVDYLELDAASNRGVDEMTQLLEQAVYAPSVGRFKVYMIDEVHMLTGHAFNAMLKTLEEPPPHVKFILATTDPQKIPVTVLSRCLQFNLKQMAPDSIVDHLEFILGQEGIPAQRSALRLLAQAARGSMRDALSLTDQAIAYSSGHLTDESMRGMLGTIDQTYLVRLLDALLVQDASIVLSLAQELAIRSLSYKGALADLSVLLSQITLAQQVPQAIADEDPLREDILRLSASMSANLLQLLYAVCVRSHADLGLAPDEYSGFVMACMRLLTLIDSAEASPVNTSGSISPSATNRSPAQADLSSASSVSAQVLRQQSAAAVTAPASTQSMAKSTLDRLLGRSETKPSPLLIKEPSVPETVLAAPPEVLAPSVSVESDALVVQDPEVLAPTLHEQSASVIEPNSVLSSLSVASWPTVATRLNVKGVAAELAKQTEFVVCQGHRVTLRVATKTLAESASVQRLELALSDYFATPVAIDIEFGETGVGTAYAEAQAERAQKQLEAQGAIENDPHLRTMIQRFDATILPNSIKPLSL